MTTIQKPWGSEKIWALTPFYTGKVISIRKGHRLSRQYHNRKVETIYVMNGPMTIEVGPDRRRRRDKKSQDAGRGYISCSIRFGTSVLCARC